MIWVILILGFLLRGISINQSLWLDEAINVLATKNFSFLGMVTEYAKADFHPPGFFIILWVWTKIFGLGEISVRIPSLIFGLLTIYVVFLIGQKIHSKALGLLSAFILATNPLHIYYSQEARMYALATLAVALNFLFFIKLIKEEKPNLLLLITSNLLVLSSDYVAYFIFPAQLLFLLFLKKKKIIRKWLMGLSFSILLGIWWIPVLLSQLNVGNATSANLPGWRLVVGSFDIKATLVTFIKFIIGRISIADKLQYLIVLSPVCLLFLFLILKGTKFIKGLFRKLLIFWLCIPIILASLVSLIIPVYSYFRVLFTLPAFILLLTLGIVSYKSKIKYLLLGIVLFIQIFSAIVYLSNSSYQREDWRGLVNYLRSKKNNALILFESSGSFPPFDYYAKGNLNTKGALADFPINDQSGLIDLQSLTAMTTNIYLVDYLVEISDPNRLVAKKLNQLGYKVLETKDFHGVGFLYYYVK